jgi:hypothetical protein
MGEIHFPRGAMLRLFRAQLDRDQVRAVIQHLLRRCPVCLADARRAAILEGFHFPDEELETEFDPERAIYQEVCV